MARYVEPKRDQPWLIVPHLGELVPKDHAARFIVAFLEKLDLEKAGFFERTKKVAVRSVAGESLLPGVEIPCKAGEEAQSLTQTCQPNGRSAYHPSMMLGIYLYGMLHRQFTVRALAHACRNDIGMIWLCGGHAPDPATIWRFLDRHRERMKTVFVQALEVAQSAGMLGMVLFAVDGTKLQAASSTRTAMTLKRLEKTKRQLEEAMELTMKAMSEDGEKVKLAPGLPRELEDQQKLYASVQEALSTLEEKKVCQFNPVEPDALPMLMKDGRLNLGYNAQTVVDSKHRLIVATDVTQDGNDMGQLIPMLEQARENLGQVADLSLADSGYDTPDTFALAEALEMDVLTHSQHQTQAAKNAFHASHFPYDPASDTVTCPKGKTLRRAGQKKDRKGRMVQRYRADAQDCKACPFRSQCFKSKRTSKEILRAPSHEAWDRQRQKRGDPKMKELLRLRASIVELPFAWAKHFFSRFTVRTLEKAKTQWSMIALALNLTTILKYWQPT